MERRSSTVSSTNIGTSTLVIAWILTFFIACLPSARPPQRAPVVLVPGNGGNQLWGRVTNSSDPCLQRGDWHSLFIDMWSLWPGTMKCWSKKRTLVYNHETGNSENQPGLETRVPGWGGTDSVDYLDPSWTAYLFGNLGAYMDPLITEMRSWNYKDGVDLFAAPYDWRFLPQSQNFFQKLQNLIEDAYSSNGDRKVALVAHSLGGRYALMFLQQMSKKWKKKYIHSLITVGTSWGGVANSFLAFASGYSLVPFVQPIDVRHEQRSSESNLFLLPTKFAFKDNETIVKTSSRNYTIENYNDFFKDIGYPIGYRRLVAMDNFRNQIAHPGVPLHCLFGYGISTEAMFTYNEAGFPEDPPDVQWGDGDGTVNINSLRSCEQWDKEETFVKGFSSVHHLGILSDTRVLKYLKTVLVT